jgi:hypothetical protein
MQQQIGFCTTADGIRIAYATMGAAALMVARSGPSRAASKDHPAIPPFLLI